MNRLNRPLLAVIVLTAAWGALALWGQGEIEGLMDRVAGLGAWGPAGFILLYIVCAVLLVPSPALTLGAGAVFGLGHGLWIVSVAATLGAAAAFLAGRYLIRDAVLRKLAGYPVLSRLDGALATGGWKLVVLTRLSPVLPYTLLNYAFSLTRIRFSHFVTASWAGMLPAKLLLVYTGSLARMGAGPEAMTPARILAWASGFLATLAAAVITTRRARRVLAGMLPPEPPSGRGKS